MRIVIIGAGAMGSIYGGHLSLKNEVFLVDKNKMIVDVINKQGLILQEDGRCNLYHPKAMLSTEGIGTVDLVILFVKALFSKVALEENRGVIGEHTYVLTLQNGSGHEEMLKQFVSINRIIIGTTEDNGAVLESGQILHGGNGKTNIGMLTEDYDSILDHIKENFDLCGFNVFIHENIQQLIWDKLFTNISLSVVTGILQVPMGFISENPYAWCMTEQLLKELPVYYK